MAHFDPLLVRNRDFATTNAREGTSISAKLKVYVITCLDPRTDPSAFLELALGDATLAAEAVVHPEQTVRADVDLLRSSTILPATITVSGHVYDVNTGLITTIVPAAPMHSAAAESA